MTVVDAYPLMLKYLDGKPMLTNDEREILLFALYLESVHAGGIALKASKELRKEKNEPDTVQE